MDIHERLSTLRAQLGLTTHAFGSSIHMTGGAVTNMEKGRREITERTIKDICREYRVNQAWLTTGDGEMFDAQGDLTTCKDVKSLPESYSRLSEEDKSLVKNLIRSLAEKNPKKTK